MEKYKAGRFLFWGYMLRKYQGENLRLDSPFPSGLCHMTLSQVGFLTLAPGKKYLLSTFYVKGVVQVTEFGVTEQ